MSDRPRPPSRRRPTSLSPEEPAGAEPVAPPSPPAPTVAPGPHLDAGALVAELESMTAADFAALLGQGAPALPEPGEQVTGTVVRVERDAVFVDLGAKAEGVIEGAELEERPAVGDRVTAFVLHSDERGIRLARRLSGRASWDALDQARESGVPVNGRVESRNAGGFTVKIGSVNAFCPVSLIDRVAGDLDAYVGRTLLFHVVEIRGRDVVVSHRSIAEEEARLSSERVWESIAAGDARRGTVTAVKEYGVFVDIDGVRGLVPKREMSWDAEAPPPAVGSTVEVRVIEVDREARKLTLSLRDPAFAPWSRLGTEFNEGDVVAGKITRLADFGAFVAIAPGLEGMVHVSNLSAARVDHPRDLVRPGQDVRVRILSFDKERERLELGIKQAHDDWVPERTGKARPAQSGSLGTMADLFKGVKVRG